MGAGLFPKMFGKNIAIINIRSPEERTIKFQFLFENRFIFYVCVGIAVGEIPGVNFVVPTLKPCISPITLTNNL